MNEKIISILQLYPQDMNIYGDWGNVLTLKRRLEWYGYKVQLHSYNQGDAFPDDIDIIVGGGGQDNGQAVIQNDLLGIGVRLHDLAQTDTPMLMVCGLYQLFGHYFRTSEGRSIEGISLLDLTTEAGSERMTGNITTQSEEFGRIIGYENHSGQTYLGASLKPLGQVIKGGGNNGKDGTEGVLLRNVIGTYLHGSLLPKNPQIADYLIEKAVIKRYGEFNPTVIDDRFAQEARNIAFTRPR